MQASRFRERVTENDVEDIEYISSYSDPEGTCSTSAGSLKTSSIYVRPLINKYQYESMYDTVTPDFHRLVSEGKIVNNEMEKITITEEDTGVFYAQDFDHERYGCSPSRWYLSRHYNGEGRFPVKTLLENYSCPTVEFSQNEIDVAVSLASARAYSYMQDQEILLGATLGELDKTIVGTTQTLRKVYLILRDLVRLDLEDLRGHVSPSELQDAYMNARYNLRPLYYDLKGLYGLGALEERPPRQTFRSKQFGTKSLSSPLERVILTWDDSTVKMLGYTQTTVNLTIRAGILAAPKPTSLEHRLGLNAPIDTVWELIPLSFVVDWFLNVGSFLKAWTPCFTWTQLASWYTVEETVYQKKWLTELSGYPVESTAGWRLRNVNLSFSPGHYVKMVRKKTRVPSLSRPDFIHVNVRLDPLKVLDLTFIVGALLKLKLPRLAG